MTETTIVVRVDKRLKAAFVNAAKAADRTVSQLIRDFMRDYVRRAERVRELARKRGQSKTG